MPASIRPSLGTNPKKSTIKTIEFLPAIDFLYLFRYDAAKAATAAAVTSEAKRHKMIKLSRKELEEGLKETPLSTILGESVSKALTGKQKAFALEVARGQTKTNAYRKAYKANPAPSTINNEPYKLMADPRIARASEAYALAIEAAKHRNPAALRELVISGLVEIALSPDTKDAVKVAALRTIGTITEVSAFTIRTETKTITSSETAKASILAQLQTLMQGEAVDVVSRDADSLLAELRTTDTLSESAPVPDAMQPDADPPVGGEAAEGSGVPSL